MNKSTPTRYWLMKSEPDEAGIDHLARDGVLGWFGVRNYQARNFMRDGMQPGDQVLFYHSSCPQPGIAGIAEVTTPAYPDPTQFDPQSKYFDAKSSQENPRWVQVDVKFVKKTRLLELTEMRGYPELAEMQVLQRGNRLSITPVTRAEWDFIQQKL